MRSGMTDARWHRFTRRPTIAMALMGAIAWWGGVSAPMALAGDAEELFVPYRTAGLLQLRMPAQPPPRSGSSVEEGGERPDRSLVAAGIRLIREREYARAIALLEPFKSQDDFLTLYALGVAYVRTHRNAEAYDVLLRAHKLNPSIAGPLLPAALACARMAKRCDDYRKLAQDYVALGGKFRKFADKIASHQPYALALPKRP
jgi:tetratricopeptide (TPR) repeat protein